MQRRYVHFTSLDHAAEIESSGCLMKSSFIDGVYAVAVGGYSSPGVQQTRLGRTSDRSVAIVFETDVEPNFAYPEEIIWKNIDCLPIRIVDILPTEDAVKLLDDSIPYRDEDTLDIPHTIPTQLESYISAILEESLSATDLASSLRAKYDIELWMREPRWGDEFEPAIATLDSIVVPKERRKEGVGSKAMEDIVQWADELGVIVSLHPSSDFGGSVAKLRKFYAKFGFVPNKGRNKDFRTRDAMIRYPKKSIGESCDDMLSEILDYDCSTIVKPTYEREPTSMRNPTMAGKTNRQIDIMLLGEAPKRLSVAQLDEIIIDERDKALAEQGGVRMYAGSDETRIGPERDDQDDAYEAFFNTYGEYPTDIYDVTAGTDNAQPVWSDEPPMSEQDDDAPAGRPEQPKRSMATDSNAQFYLNPYAGSEKGAYFSSLEEYKALSKRMNAQGIEEWEIDWIDGDEKLRLVWEAAGGSSSGQMVLDQFMDEVVDAYLEDYELAALGFLMGDLGYDLGDALKKYNEVSMSQMTPVEYVQDYFEETMEIPSVLRFYIDWESMARDLSINGFINEFDFNGESYVVEWAALGDLELWASQASSWR